MRWRIFAIGGGAAMFLAATGAWLLAPPPTPPMPDEASRAAILAFARSRISGADAPPPAIGGEGVRAVIVSAYGAAGKRTAWRDVSGDVGSAITAAADEIRGPIERVVRVDLVGKEKRVRQRSRWALFQSTDPGIDGFALRGEPFHFLGPSDAVERSQPSHDGVPRLVRQNPKGKLTRFRAASFVEGAGDSNHPISRGNVLPPWPPTAEDLREAAGAGGRYLAGKQYASGLFNYQYDAKLDRAEGGYNLLRHCGTAMSMYQVYGLTKDESVKAAADRALEWVERTSLYFDPDVPGAMFLKEIPEHGGEIKLGAMGLAVLAMMAAQEHGGPITPERADLARAMGNAILHLQQPSGELRSYHGPKGRAADPRRSIYYPGEATLALVRLYRWDGDQKWLDAAKRSAEFQATKRWTWGGLQMFYPPDAWGAQSLEELWHATKDDRFAKWGFVIGDELLRTTFSRHANIPPDLVGATVVESRVIRVTPTSSRNEAVVALVRLARDVGDAKRARRYRDAAVDAAWFGTAQQYRAENTYWVKSPEAAMGGIRESVIHSSVRIDGVQHALTGLLGVADLLEAEQKR